LMYHWKEKQEKKKNLNSTSFNFPSVEHKIQTPSL
jgi:hypothetical protein